MLLTSLDHLILKLNVLTSLDQILVGITYRVRTSFCFYTEHVLYRVEHHIMLYGSKTDPIRLLPPCIDWSFSLVWQTLGEAAPHIVHLVSLDEPISVEPLALVQPHPAPKPHTSGMEARRQDQTALWGRSGQENAASYIFTELRNDCNFSGRNGANTVCYDISMSPKQGRVSQWWENVLILTPSILRHSPSFMSLWINP